MLPKQRTSLADDKCDRLPNSTAFPARRRIRIKRRRRGRKQINKQTNNTNEANNDAFNSYLVDKLFFLIFGKNLT